MDSLNLIMNFFASLMLVGISLLARLNAKTWLDPGAFFALLWTIYSISPLLLAPGYFVSSSAVWWIVVCVTTVYFGSAIGRAFIRGDNSESIGREIKFPFCITLIVCGTLAGIVGFLYFLHSTGATISTLFSIQQLSHLARKISVERYLDGLVLPILTRILSTGMYVGAILGGIYYSNSLNRKRKFVSFAPFLPAALLAIVTTAKAYIIFAIVLWLGGLLATSVLRGERVRFFRPQVLIRVSIIFSLLLVGFGLIQMARYSFHNVSGFYFVLNRFKVYEFGYLPTFSYWFTDVNPKPSLTWGSLSFAGIFQLMGFGTRVQGVYQDYVTLGGGGTSNVYTVFRGLIEDFGIVGSLLVQFIFGFVSGLSYEGAKRGNVMGLAGLTAVYGIMLWSNTISLLDYNSLVLAFLILLAYTVFIQLRHTKAVLDLDGGAVGEWMH